MSTIQVFVYFNLHRLCWSVKALNGASRGRVIAHGHTVTVQGARFRVSEAGRQRVLRERRKNVHAGVVGTLVAVNDGLPMAGDARDWLRVAYNPYTGPHFTECETHARVPVQRADVVRLQGRQVLALNAEGVPHG